MFLPSMLVTWMKKTRNVKNVLAIYQLIFISPESLLSTNLWHDVLLSPVYQENLVGVIVDEAHCVKKW